jgi:hypothetical protein
MNNQAGQNWLDRGTGVVIEDHDADGGKLAPRHSSSRRCEALLRRSARAPNLSLPSASHIEYVPQRQGRRRVVHVNSSSQILCEYLDRTTPTRLSVPRISSVNLGCTSANRIGNRLYRWVITCVTVACDDPHPGGELRFYPDAFAHMWSAPRTTVAILRDWYEMSWRKE